MATALDPDRAPLKGPGPSVAPETVRVPSPPSSRRRVILAIVILLAIAAVVWAVQKWRFASTHETTDDAQVDGRLVPVIAKVGGFIRDVNVGENQRVAAGSVLVRIDDAEYRARLNQADADLAAAQYVGGGRGITGQAEAQVQSASNQREALDAQVAAAQANQQKAQADLERVRDLVAKQIVSKQQLDALQAAADAANANLIAVRRQAAGAGAGIVNAQAGARLAQARILGAQAMRDNAALQLQYTSIVAPLSGIVSRKQVEPGQLVQAGQPLLTIVSDSAVWVTANFKETQLADVRVGQPVTVEVDAYPGCDATGSVESIGAATGAKFALLPPDNATGNFTKVVQRVPVRLAIAQGCGAERPLRPGMSVVAHVRTR